jgi:hypothetical protein
MTFYQEEVPGSPRNSWMTIIDDGEDATTFIFGSSLPKICLKAKDAHKFAQKKVDILDAKLKYLYE